ncbi:TSUP family transporter [Synechococcus sp. BIOS-U3-1]|uniref:TSUP family transporter n=1 Tax=Synechococcus sp. BIOS-U3-1 TaxID=1400865 RepID=UPI00351C7918|tara:strand:+ start:1951 stop:2730 length:780 start_codon:yes stop_codon:yes gene_type:complete
MAAMTLAEVLLAVPLGLLAGALAGLLGIGGGLIFAPLLLWMGFSPHQALATSTFAIVPTAIGGSYTHWRARTLQLRPGLAIGLSAFATALVFSRLGRLAAGWQLLTLQALLYLLLALTIRGDRSDQQPESDQPLPLKGLTAVGGVAGLAGGMLGLGGGLLMVPLMVNGLSVPIRQAIRLSTLAVACSASAASLQFLHEGRGQWMQGLVLGAVAAFAAQWTAARLDRVNSRTLAWLLRVLSLLLAVDSGRRAVQLVLQLG